MNGKRIDGWLHPLRETLYVFSGLVLDLHQGRALRFGLDDSGWLAVQEEEVIDPPMWLLKSELPDGDTDPGTQIELVLALDQPTRLAKLLVDLDTSQRLSGQVAVLVGLTSRHGTSE